MATIGMVTGHYHDDKRHITMESLLEALDIALNGEQPSKDT
jgi:hypothetical protein